MMGVIRMPSQMLKHAIATVMPPHRAVMKMTFITAAHPSMEMRGKQKQVGANHGA